MNIEILEKYHKEGLLEKQVHPSLPLAIWNYSQEVQYKDLWDEILIHCRGLVTDSEGNVIAKPFKKFFNIEENKHTPSDTFTIWEKVDGSLGILFWYADEWHLCTRSSFTSDQSVKGKEILARYDDGWKSYLRKDFTYLFEIVYPENQIVIDYGDEEELVLLGAVATATGSEMTPSEAMVCNDWFKEAKEYAFEDYKELKALNCDNEEGFVVHFDNGEKCKIKFDWYLKRHKIVWSLTNRLLWEYLSEGRLEELIVDVPDEFYHLVDEEVKNFENLYRVNEIAYKHIFDCADKSWTRKQFAEYALKYKEPQVLFKMLDGRSHEETIWKILYPKVLVKILNKNI